MRLLVTSTESFAGDLLVRVLRDEGFDVDDCVPVGDELFAALEERLPDVLLGTATGATPAGPEAAEFVHRVRSRWPALPVAVLGARMNVPVALALLAPAASPVAILMRQRLRDADVLVDALQ